MDTRKGISPLIAAVLLIAFTMAVASIFAQWAPQLIQNAQGDTINRSEQIQKCSGIILEFVEGSNTSATVQQTSGESEAGRMTTTWFYDDASPIQVSSKWINSSRGFATYDLNSTALGYNKDRIGNNLVRIEAQPTNCEGTAPAVYEP